MLAVLERDETFRSFTLDGQAVVLEDYLELRPEHEERLRALLATGRLVVGPSYVLPDELLVGGESLVRNLLLGRAVCERLGAAPSGAGYLPDSFGHPAQLPQVLARFGIESFLFSRGLGDEVDHVGRVFRWLAPDGSEVTAFNLLGHYGSAALLASAEDLIERAERIAERHRAELARAGLRDVLLCNGSDHLPLQPELPVLLRRAEELLPGARFELASFDEYLAAARPSRRLPIYRGELLGSREQNVLRGVNSARVYLKQANERAERHLLAAETAAALAALAGRAPYPSADFRFAWRELLRNQPHDSICGCSVDEVHEDMMERYARLERTISVLERKAMGALSGGGLPLEADQADELYRSAPRAAHTVLNPLPWRRRRLLEVELPPRLRRAPALAAECSGAAIPVTLAGGRALVVVELDGFEAAGLELRPTTAAPASGRRRASIANEHYRVEAAADGTLTVTDLRSGRRHRGLHRLEDEPDGGDLYTFCPVTGASPWRNDAKDVSTSARVLREGPLVSELELTVVARLPRALDSARLVTCRLRTVVRLVSGIDRIELETEVDNRARDHRLRVVFAAPEAGDTVRAEGQFAVAERPLVPPAPRTDWAEPPDATQHTLGAVALGDLALFTKGLPEYEARGKPGDAELALTLLRCVGVLSRRGGEIATRPRGAGPSTPTPGGQCLGSHRFEYAIRFGATSLDEVALLRAGHDYRHDFLMGPPGTTAATSLELAGDPLAFSCLKGGEDGEGVVLRLFNPGHRPARVRLDARAALARERLDETEAQPVHRRAATLRSGEIATFRLR